MAFILQSISGPKDQQALLSEFNPDRGTWIVSDLKAKLDLQRRLLGKREFLNGESILRASELWKVLLTRLRPDIQIISKEFATTLVAEELANRTEPWAQSPGAAQTAYKYLCQLMPILSHPQGKEMMAEWFEAHPASRIRWGRWFDLGVELWAAFLERGVIAAPWVSGVLVNEVGFEQVWSRPLIFDLGAEMNQVEADLIATLANFIPLTVIQPRPVWRDEYKRTLLPYESLEKKPKLTKTFFTTGDSDQDRFREREYKKFTTMLAEVKHAVSTARKWIETGVEPKAIAIAAPDIEVYWPTLAPYLEQEGIPCQKSRVARVHSFPDISQWLSTLRLKTGGHEESDLEVSLFERSESPALSFEKFRVLYSALYTREDLERDSEMKNLYSIELKSDEYIARDSFVAWALRSLPENAEKTRVETLFKKLFDECPESTELRVSRWLTYTEELATKTEVRIKEGAGDGIAVINLESCENSPSTHMLLLGLTESALKSGAETAILFGDIMSLSASFGFHLQSNDLAKLEFEARWVIDNSSRRLILCVPETDFDGAVQAPAWLWVKGSREVDTDDFISLPGPTRWDEVQRAPLDEIAKMRRWDTSRSTRLKKSLEEDMGLKALPNFAADKVASISASAIEDYLTCPFIFASTRLFRLSDLPTLDLDVDASTRGKMIHALFERLTHEPMLFEYTDDEIHQAVDHAREQANVQIYDERFWPSMRFRYAEMAKRFLAFEKDWRERFKETRTLDREVMVKGFVDKRDGGFYKDAGEGRIRFTGMIDRIDVDNSGHAVVIDYKSSDANCTQWSRWLSNCELQLILYTLAFESGLSKHAPSEVVSAVYYIAKTMDRDKGFKVDDVEQKLFEIEGRKQNKLPKIKREEIFRDAQKMVQSALQKMDNGDFAPVPADIKICKTCRWSSVCRAPHLNT